MQLGGNGGARRAVRTLGLAVVLTALGCGGGGGKAGGEGEVIEVTLDSLPEADRQAFAAWKLRPLKACAWYEAFPALAQAHPPPEGGGYGPARPRVDLDLFIEAITGSSPDGSHLPIVQGSGGELVLFGAPPVETTTEAARRSEKLEQGGVTTAFDVSSERRDGECVITLAGQEVFRARLASQLPVILGYDPARPRSAPAELASLAEKRTSEGLTEARLDPGALLSGAQAALAPTAEDQALLAARFGITLDQAKQVFPLGDPLPPDSAALTSVGGAPVDPSLVTPFGPGRYLHDRSGTDGERVLEALCRPGTVTLDLLYAPRLGPDGALIRLAVSVGVTSSLDAASTPHTFAELSGVTLGGGVQRTDAAAVDCFLARYAAATPWVTRTTPPTREYAPSYGPCAALSPDPAGALASDGRARTIVVREVESIARPSAYSSWDWALVDLADAAITRGIGLDQLPGGIGTYSIAARTAELGSYLEAVADPAARASLQRALVQLAYDQHFAGWQLDGTQRAALLGALQKASSPFTASTATMLRDLLASDRDPGLRAAACGAALSSELIAAIQAAATGAASYAYGERFAERLRGATLQACYTQADLDEVAVALAAARAFTDAERGRSPGPSFEGQHQALVDRALDERWTGDAYAGLADELRLAMAGDRGLSCSTDPTLSEQVGCTGDLGGAHAWLSAAGGLLDPAFAGRYPALARELRPWLAEKLDRSTHFVTRDDLEDGFFGEAGLWRGCAAAEFTARRTSLLGLLQRLVTTADAFDRMDVEGEIEALVKKDCATSG
jgi:hypothetical protein